MFLTYADRFYHWKTIWTRVKAWLCCLSLWLNIISTCKVQILKKNDGSTPSLYVHGRPWSSLADSYSTISPGCMRISCSLSSWSRINKGHCSMIVFLAWHGVWRWKKVRRKHEKNEQLKMIIVEEQKGCSEDESFFKSWEKDFKDLIQFTFSLAISWSQHQLPFWISR